MAYSIAPDKQGKLREAWIALFLGLFLILVTVPFLAVWIPTSWYKVWVPDFIAASTLTVVVYVQGQLSS
jgi:hypothetical protein